MAADTAEQEQLEAEQAEQLAEAEMEVEKDPLSNNSQAEIDIDQTASDTFTTEDSDDEVSNKEILDKLDNGQVDSSKRKAKKERQRERKKAEEERKKRKAGETGNANSKNMRKDEPDSMVARRRSLSGGLVPMTSPSRDYAQVSASPVNSDILPKTPILSHTSSHNFNPPTF